MQTLFESFANSKRYKTLFNGKIKQVRLRALLIQKDTKHCGCLYHLYHCLRALLIQKDTKLREQIALFVWV